MHSPEPWTFRIPLADGESHQNNSDSRYRYGCYFPLTDLVVGDMGGRGTGEPTNVERIGLNPEAVREALEAADAVEREGFGNGNKARLRAALDKARLRP